ncbi:hypothetical protein F4808DRAFT_121615 [Astrocystis sublimbata]|nr:hypothetical protein F4808DRAFT_121615 [Astrocystis sublimbata]
MEMMMICVASRKQSTNLVACMCLARHILHHKNDSEREAQVIVRECRYHQSQKRCFIIADSLYIRVVCGVGPEHATGSCSVAGVVSISRVARMRRRRLLDTVQGESGRRSCGSASSSLESIKPGRGTSLLLAKEIVEVLNHLLGVTLPPNTACQQREMGNIRRPGYKIPLVSFEITSNQDTNVSCRDEIQTLWKLSHHRGWHYRRIKLKTRPGP